MNKSQKAGVAFGLTSGVITTLGIMIGLNAATTSKLVVISGILTIAIADAFSDAFGIHVSQESSTKNSHKQVWQATFSTFFAKLITASTFLIPVLIFPLKSAIVINIAWGFFLIITLNYFLAKSKQENPFHIIFEHVGIAIIVILITNFVGKLISIYF